MNSCEQHQARRTRWLAGLLAVVTAILVPFGSGASDPPGRMVEYQRKAAYLVNLLRFVEWPAGTFASTNAPVVIGVLGRGETWPQLQEAAKQTTGRPCELRLWNALSPESKCHVLFVERDNGFTPADVRRAMENSPTLVVGETEGFAQAGGMIGLGYQSERVQLFVNLDAVSRAGLKLSARLASVATAIPAPPKAAAR